MRVLSLLLWAAGASSDGGVALGDLPPPVVLTFGPTSGPTLGGTLVTFSGAAFTSGAQPACRFGHSSSSVPGTFAGVSTGGTVTCAAPAAEAGYEVPVEMSVDNVSFTAAGHTFTYYHEVVVSASSPSSGPADGGTRVTVHGYNVLPSPLLRCVFGWRRVRAAYVDFENAACVAPAHTANGSVSLAFENGLEALPDDGATGATARALGGALSVADGVLRLGGGAGGVGPTDGVAKGCGLLALEVDRGTSAAPRGFRARFEYFFDTEESLAGSSPKGIVLSYGLRATGGLAGLIPTATNANPEPPGEWDERGGAVGLAVRLLAHPQYHWRPLSIEVALDGVTVERSIVGRGVLVRGAWAQIMIELDPFSRVLRVFHDGVQRLVTELPAWFIPIAQFEFSLCGCSGDPSTAQLVDNLRLESSAALATAPLDLRLTMNDGAASAGAAPLSAGAAPFSFYAPPSVACLSPSSGPALGGTLVAVSGHRLAAGSDRRCRFGSIEVTATVAEHGGVACGDDTLLCVSPTQLAGVGAAVEVTLNGQQYTSDAHAFAVYSGDARVSAVTPSLAPLDGGTLLAVSGAHLGGGSDYRCRFGGNSSSLVVASFNGGAATVECYAPPLPRAAHAVQLSLNGQQFTTPGGGGTLSARPAPVVTAVRSEASVRETDPADQPAAEGPQRGGTVLLVHGRNFFGNLPDLTLCRFGAALVAGTVVSDDTLRCAPTPDADAAGAQLAYESNFDGGELEAPLTLSGGAVVKPRFWAGPGGFMGGNLRLSAPAEGGGVGGAVLAFPPLYDTAGCAPPLGSCGYARLAPTPWPHVTHFELRFRLRLGAALGFSVSFGALDSDDASGGGTTVPLGDWGGGDGLRVLWRAVPAEVAAPGAPPPSPPPATLVVMYDFEIVAEVTLAPAGWDDGNDDDDEYDTDVDATTPAPPPPAAPPPADDADDADAAEAAVAVDPNAPTTFVSVVVRYGGGGLTVQHGTLLAVDSLRIDGWDPQPGWRVGVGARAVADPYADSDASCAIDDVVFRAGASLSFARVLVAVTLNGQDFYGIPGRADAFTYTGTRIDSVTPKTGPAAGGVMLTIRGMGFDGGWAYRCRIGAATVLANFTSEVTDDCAIPPCVLCVTPPYDGSALLDVEIALDARTFTTDGVTHFAYAPIVSAVAPRSSPVAGGAGVVVHGSHFGGGQAPSSWCWFGTDLDGTGRVPASYANGGVGDGSDDMLHCDAPAAKEAGVAPVRVSLDNLAWSNTSADFTYTGSTVAFAAPFPPDPPGMPPRLPNASSPPPPPPSEPPAPGLPPSSPLVGIAEEDKTAGLPVVYGISPSSGPSGGGTPLTVTGNGLAGGDGYRCRFGTMRSPWRAAASNVVDATFVDANTLHCDAPDAAAAATAILWRDFMDPLSRNGACNSAHSAARFARPPLIPPATPFSLPQWPPWIHVPYSRIPARPPPLSDALHPPIPRRRLARRRGKT